MNRSIILKKYQVFTPEAMVEKMLLLLKRRSQLFGKAFLENSCGDGRFILKYVSMYVASCQREGMPWETICIGLNRDVVGYELDKHKLNACKKALDELMKRFGCPNKVLWRLHNEDFLRAKINRTFDFIVGNPPYLSYWDIPANDRVYIKSHFRLCQKGLWDYCFAFIEKSLSLLNNLTGQFCYIIPSSIFKTKSAHGIRGALVDHLSYIGEYGSRQVFDEVLTSAAIVLVDNNCVSQYVRYQNNMSCISCKEMAIPRRTLREAHIWCFSSKPSSVGKRRFGDFFRVSSSVATLCNDAFVLKGWRKLNEDFIEDTTSGERIEMGAVRCAARPKCFRGKRDQYIIFPYSFNSITKNWEIWTETEFRQKFPNAFTHLRRYKKRLVNRTSDKGTAWYGYGRSQALDSVRGDKLLISQVVTKGVNVHWLHDAELPYSGYYIQPKSSMKLRTAERVLTSHAFAAYAQSVGIGLNGNSMRLTTTNILNYTW